MILLVEILVSGTAKGLVFGSGISFAERGSHDLMRGEEPWPLYEMAQR